jgi:riboflavin kinase/FMN adenylyltransferase
MRLLPEDVRDWDYGGRRSAVTIGVLDGVHRGHQALLGALSPHLERTVLTFDPHPVEVLRPGTKPRLLTSIGERLELFEEHGVASAGILDLGEVKDLAPRVFVERYLVGGLGIAQFAAGADFRFGKDRTGDIELLRHMGSEHDFVVDVIDTVGDERGPVSSSRIRELIEAGEVGRAADDLTRPFHLSGIVVEGDRRGRELGFPTANLEPPPRMVIPGRGVYAARARLGERAWPAAVNVGVRPTFGEGTLLIEAHLLGFDEDIYGQELTVGFLAYLRPELAFADVGSLVEQMRLDVEKTAELAGSM